MADSPARMESPVERAFLFALPGGFVGVVGAMGLGGTIWVFTGHVIPGLFLAFPLGGFVGGFLVALPTRSR